MQDHLRYLSLYPGTTFSVHQWTWLQVGSSSGLCVPVQLYDQAAIGIHQCSEDYGGSAGFTTNCCSTLFHAPMWKTGVAAHKLPHTNTVTLKAEVLDSALPLFFAQWRHVFVCLADALAYFSWQASTHLPALQTISAHVDPGFSPQLFFSPLSCFWFIPFSHLDAHKVCCSWILKGKYIF